MNTGEHGLPRRWADPIPPVTFAGAERTTSMRRIEAAVVEVAARIPAFQDRYSSTADPFEWTYTRDELIAFIKGLNNHDPQRELGQAA